MSWAGLHVNIVTAAHMCAVVLVCITHLFSSTFVKVYMSVVVSNVILVDNGMGIMSLIYEPPSVTHEYSNKTVLVQVRN